MRKGIEKSYKRLILWTKFKELLLSTYELTEKLPRSEDFGLKSQMRRAIVSVISNFVEGYLKKSSLEKNRYLEISMTSLLELESQADIVLMLNYWTEEEFSNFDKKRSEAGYFLFRYKRALLTPDTHDTFDTHDRL